MVLILSLCETIDFHLGAHINARICETGKVGPRSLVQAIGSYHRSSLLRAHPSRYLRAGTYLIGLGNMLQYIKDTILLDLI